MKAYEIRHELLGVIIGNLIDKHEKFNNMFNSTYEFYTKEIHESYVYIINGILQSLDEFGEITNNDFFDSILMILKTEYEIAGLVEVTVYVVTEYKEYINNHLGSAITDNNNNNGK